MKRKKAILYKVYCTDILVDLEMKREMITVSGYLTYRWVDKRLKWNKQKYQGHSLIEILFLYTIS